MSIGQLLVVELPSNGLSSNKCGLDQHTSDHTYCGGNSTTVDTNSSTKPGDWTNAGLMFLAAVFIGHIMFTLFLHPTYKRLEVEREANKKDDNNN